MKMSKRWLSDKYFLIALTIVCLIFFYPFFLWGKIPIPADALVGLYHPFRDDLASQYPNGYPYKNPLITDPVRQQYVWRELAIEKLKKGEIPTWNPYSFSGTPLLSNFQTAAFYPLNILFFIFPFSIAWGLLVISQSILSAIFMYLYLRELSLGKQASMLASIIFPFCGYSISWMEWNTIGHTLLWLPLILLSTEKLIKKTNLRWGGILLFALVASFFAGHLQTFFYVTLFTFIYCIVRLGSLWQASYRGISTAGRKILFFSSVLMIFFVVTTIQSIPTFKFISQSARSIDQGSWQRDGWFIPIQHLLQFLAPDFFGNPTTGNYFGVFNYGEFTGYIGIIPLIFALSSIFIRKDKKTFFFAFSAFISLIFAVDNPIAKLPFILNIPFISTSMPTRLLSIADFSLTVLAALGLDYFLRKTPLQKMFILSLSLFCVICYLFLTAKVPVTKSNLYLSIIMSIICTGLLFLYKTRYRRMVIPLLVLVTILDLFRFGWKFIPFSDPSLIFPKSEMLTFLHEATKVDASRVMALDRRILPPNVAVRYKIQDVSGYDPLYLLSYNKFVSAWNNNQYDSTGANFNRIVIPENAQSQITDLIGVKYLLSLDEVSSLKWTYLLNIGNTRVYQNKYAYPRVFLLADVVQQKSESQVMNSLLLSKDLLHTAYSLDLDIHSSPIASDDTAYIDMYEENKVVVKVTAQDKRLLILTDVFYPTWKAYIDGKESKIYKVDFLFRGVMIDKGNHIVEFKNNLL